MTSEVYRPEVVTHILIAETVGELWMHSRRQGIAVTMPTPLPQHDPEEHRNEDPATAN